MTKRVTVSLPDDLYEDLRQLGSEVESSLAGQLRRGARLLLRGGEPYGEVGFDPAEWRVFGAKDRGDTSKMVSTSRVVILNARSKYHNEGAHIVVEGLSALFVLPDSRTSGQRRSRLISDALTDLEAGAPDPISYVAGRLLVEGCGVVTYRPSGEVNYGDA